MPADQTNDYQRDDSTVPIRRINLTDEADKALAHLRQLMVLPGYGSQTDTEVVSEAIVLCFNKQIAKLNGSKA